jgi:hypothetical protein
MNPTRTIHLTVHVDEKRRVLIDLPDDTPTGEVEIQITHQILSPNEEEHEE